MSASATLPNLDAAVAWAAPSFDAATRAAWVSSLSAWMTKFSITTAKQVAGFLGNVRVETGGFIELVENLNYSQAGLLATFPREFPTSAVAAAYARQPTRIGNRAYASRMGNSDEASGDGSRFCGRGLMQTTGRDSYTRAAAAFNKTADEMPAWMATVDGACAVACWDWQDMRCSPIADLWETTALARRINGGDNGLADRLAACNALLIITQSATGCASPSSSAARVLLDGDSGDDVRRLQAALQAANFFGGAVDGVFGDYTEACVRQFQRSAGLGADGVAGPATQAALGLNGVPTPPAAAAANDSDPVNLDAAA